MKKTGKFAFLLPLLAVFFALSVFPASCKALPDEEVDENDPNALKKPPIYVVRFDTQKGKPMPPYQSSLKIGSTVASVIEPELEGFIFDGWYTDKGRWKDIWNFTTSKLTADHFPAASKGVLTLYARWKAANVVQWVIEDGIQGGGTRLNELFGQLVELKKDTYYGLGIKYWLQKSEQFDPVGFPVQPGEIPDDISFGYLTGFRYSQLLMAGNRNYVFNDSGYTSGPEVKIGIKLVSDTLWSTEYAVFEATEDAWHVVGFYTGDTSKTFGRRFFIKEMWLYETEQNGDPVEVDVDGNPTNLLSYADFTFGLGTNEENSSVVQAYPLLRSSTTAENPSPLPGRPAAGCSDGLWYYGTGDWAPKEYISDFLERPWVKQKMDEQEAEFGERILNE